MVGDFIIRKHSARTLALLVRLPAHPGRARGLCSVAPLQIRTLPMVARGDARTAYATLALAHAPVGRTGSSSGVALLRFKNS